MAAFNRSAAFGRTPFFTGVAVVAFISASHPAFGQATAAAQDTASRTAGGAPPSNEETAGQIYSEHLEPPGKTLPTTRPAYQLTRWQEDWRALADPAKRTDIFDPLKYIPLAPNGFAHLTLSGQLREDFVGQSSALSGGPSADYELHRLYVGADLHVGEARAFVELGNVEAPGERKPLAPTERDDADVQLAFVDYRLYLGPTLTVPRIGRQEIIFDTTQRFLGLREGPNNRQAFDAARVDFKVLTLSFSAFSGRPVDYIEGPFDDHPNHAVTFSGYNLTHQLGADAQSVYFYRYTNELAHFGAVVGPERRDSIGSRVAGRWGGFDYDFEGMRQTGSVGSAVVDAWAVGFVAGYTIKTTWSPRLGLQYDEASGDSNPRDGRIETFNPLFGKGAYFTEAPITGYSNVRHLKGSVSLRPSKKDTFTVAFASLGKETAHDLVYLTPLIPQPRTADMTGTHTGDYVQFLGAHQFNAHFSLSGEAVRFAASDDLRRAGGHDVDYLKLVANFLF